MKISTIMVCYNSEATISDAIESFLGQSHANKELIIIDGNSSDSTLDIITSFASPDITCFSAPDDGIYDAMNKGLRVFTGDAFGFLNSDDLYAHKNVLRKMSKALETSDIVSGHLRFFRGNEIDTPIRVWQPVVFKKGSIKKGWTVPHPTTYATRHVFGIVGEFDPSYKIAGDYDWLLRAFEICGCRHQIIEEVLVNMRLGGVSTAGGGKVFLTNLREPLRSRRKWLNTGIIDGPAFRLIVRRFRRLRFVRQLRWIVLGSPK